MVVLQRQLGPSEDGRGHVREGSLFTGQFTRKNNLGLQIGLCREVFVVDRFYCTGGAGMMRGGGI